MPKMGFWLGNSTSQERFLSYEMSLGLEQKIILISFRILGGAVPRVWNGFLAVKTSPQSAQIDLIGLK